MRMPAKFAFYLATGAFVISLIFLSTCSQTKNTNLPKPLSVTYDVTTLLHHRKPILRFYAAQKLIHSKKSEVEKVLIELLKEKDAYIRRESAYLLGEARSTTAIPELMQLIQAPDKEIEVISAAVQALGDIGDPQSVPLLIEVLRKTYKIPRGQFRYEPAHPSIVAATALGKIGDIRAVKPLKEFLFSERLPRGHHTAARAIARIIGVKAFPLQAEYKRKFEPIFKEDFDDIAYVLFEGFLDGPDKQKSKIILQIAQNPKHPCCDDALWYLSHAEDPDATSFLLYRLQSEHNSSRRITLMQMLSNSKEARANPILLNNLIHQLEIEKEPDRQRLLMETLGKFGNQKAGEVMLNTLVNNTGADNWYLFTDLIGRLKDPSLIQKVIPLLHHSNPQVVESAILLLHSMRLGDTTAIPYLRPFLNSVYLSSLKLQPPARPLRNWYTRAIRIIQYRAEDALISLGDEKALLSRIHRLYEEQKPIRKVLATLKIATTEKSEKSYIQLLSDPDTTIRYWAKAFHPLVLKYANPQASILINEEHYRTRMILTEHHMDMELGCILPMFLMMTDKSFISRFQVASEFRKELETFLQSDDPNFRIIAASWLYVFGNTGYRETLMKSTTGLASLHMTYAIEKLLEDIKIQAPTESALLKALNNPDVYTRKATAEQLKRLTGKDFYWEKPNPRGLPRDRLKTPWIKFKSLYLKLVETELTKLAQGCEGYYVDYSVYPRELRFLTTPIAYVPQIPNDPFHPDHPYQYNIPRDPFCFIITSLGPDGKDDVDEELFNFFVASPYQTLEIQTSRNQSGDFTFRVGYEIYSPKTGSSSGDIIRTNWQPSFLD